LRWRSLRGTTSRCPRGMGMSLWKASPAPSQTIRI